MRDYYAVLGVGAGATAVEIRRAYQRLARRYSPDVNLWERDARALFEEITEAYRILSDPTARSVYDRRGTQREPGGDVRATGGRRGDDVHVPVELSFAQAMAGVAVDLPIERLSACPACRATGAAPGAAPVACSHCGGLGTIWKEDSRVAGVCPACDGAGVRVSEPCRGCRGRGVAPSRATVHLVLPPGLDTGAQVRVSGEGHAGPFGGARGDLIVSARVHEDPRYVRKGDNLYCEVPLTLVEAVLGTTVRVRGIDGVVELVVPAGTQSGQSFRLRGKGVRRLTGEGRGDLYVTTRVEIPRVVEPRAVEMFRELERLLPDRPSDSSPRGARE